MTEPAGPRSAPAPYARRMTEHTTAPTVPREGRASTLGALRESGWTSRRVADELRTNLEVRIAAGEPLAVGILGYEDTVLPQLENAILAGHDVILLGERGQAKTRILRSLVDLLDEWLPIVATSEINDDPYAPVSRQAKNVVFTADHAAQSVLQFHRALGGCYRGLRSHSFGFYYGRGARRGYRGHEAASRL